MYPNVQQDFVAQFIMEGKNINVSLAVPGTKDPFPPLITSSWTFEGQNLTTANKIILSKYNISINSAQRNMSGTYTLTVTNSVGLSSGSFKLEVLCELL